MPFIQILYFINITTNPHVYTAVGVCGTNDIAAHPVQWPTVAEAAAHNVVCSAPCSWFVPARLAWPMLWPHSEARVHAVIRVSKVNCNIRILFCDDSDIKQLNRPHCHCCKWFWCNFRPNCLCYRLYSGGEFTSQLRTLLRVIPWELKVIIRRGIRSWRYVLKFQNCPDNTFDLLVFYNI